MTNMERAAGCCPRHGSRGFGQCVCNAVAAALDAAEERGWQRARDWLVEIFELDAARNAEAAGDKMMARHFRRQAKEARKAAPPPPSGAEGGKEASK